MTRLFIALASAILILPLSSFAQEGDAEAGKSKSAPCAACHGVDGNSTSAEFPHLAGQVSGYIAAQLAAFKSGERNNAVMAGMVGNLSEQDMADLDAFYNGQAPAEGAISEEDQDAALAGQKIYRAGFGDFDVPACMGCHGPAGNGIEPTFPRLAGQPAAYISSQLEAYKSGERQNAMMHKIAFPLTAEQIEQLSIYISGLN